MAGLLAPSLLALYSPAPHFSRALLGAEVVPKGVTGLDRQSLRSCSPTPCQRFRPAPLTVIVAMLCRAAPIPRRIEAERSAD